MNENTLANALVVLGFNSGWVCDNSQIYLWEREEPQPTEEELVAAGWVKPE